MTIAIADIESNNLLLDATTIHCIAIKLIKDDNAEQTRVFTSRPVYGSDGDLTQAMEILKTVDKVVFHNGIKFDIPCINKLLGINLWDFTNVDDTLLMSQLAYPNLLIIDSNNSKLPPKLKGSHSLKSWGYRLGELKGVFGDGGLEEWATLTSDMVEYNRQDVEVTYKLYKRLLTKNIPEEALWLEYNFARIIQRQEQFGVWFDIKKAEQLHVKLIHEKEVATKSLHEVFTPLLLPDGKPTTPAKPYKRLGVSYNGTHQKIKLTQFNPSSRTHIAVWFKRWYGWKSPIQTENGNDKIDESVLLSLDFHEAKVLAHYFNVNKLLGQLADGQQAWMKQVRSDTGRIHGSVNTIGAVSRRCTHSNPNMAQVPSSRAYMGHECRELFCVPPGKKMVGCDADALELRTLSHYMARYDGGSYGRTVDSGDKNNGTDIHTVNQKAAGLPTRDDAKTFIYALCYGAGAEKLGSIIGGDARDGTKIKARFFKRIPALKALTEGVSEAVKKQGYIKALDGNPYFIRSEHSALNTLLQGAGSLVMKYYLIEVDTVLGSKYKQGTQYEFLLNVHDEIQIECDEEIAEDIKKVCEEAFNKVTERLKFRIPLRGTASIGQSWADTH